MNYKVAKLPTPASFFSHLVRTPAPAFKRPRPPLEILTISPRRSSLGYAGFPHSLLSSLPFRVPAPKPAGNWSPSGHGLHLPEGSMIPLGGLAQKPRAKGIRAHPTPGWGTPWPRPAWGSRAPPASRDARETLSDQAPECGAGVKPEGGASRHFARPEAGARGRGERGGGRPATNPPEGSLGSPQEQQSVVVASLGGSQEDRKAGEPGAQSEMWGSSRNLCSPEWPRASSLGSSDRCPHQNQLSAQTRRQRKNHTSKLHELALLLPVALKTGIKKLTKKEILLHVLHYIQYLQRSIDVAKALLKFHTTNGEGGHGGCAGRNSASGAMRRRHSTPSSSPHSRKSRLQGACRKPRKKKLTGFSERQTRAQNPRRSLALDKPKKWMTLSPEQQGRNAVGTATPSRCASSCCHPKVASSLPQGDRKGGQLTLLDMAENSIHCDFSGCCCRIGGPGDGLYCAFKAQQGAERIHFLNRTQPHPRQKLVFYDSSEELDKDSPDADPWLPAWTPEGSPHGSLLDLGPPQIANWSVTGHPSEILGFSPSLFSSPGKLPPEQILEDGTEFLTQDRRSREGQQEILDGTAGRSLGAWREVFPLQLAPCIPSPTALFEEVWLDPMPSLSDSMLEALQNKEMPSEAPEDAPDPHGLCQSSVSLDHCYLSLSENSKVPSSSSSEDTDTESEWKQQEDTQADPEGLPSSSDEDRDCTWTPTRRTTTLPTAGRKAKKGRAGRGPTKPKENKKAPCQPQMKKKCVNGFIMFCRMNRKQYIRACPGTASTAATKELAQLWRVMTQQERRPYCIKARRFSLQHNRIVKQDSSSSEDEDWGTPKPFLQFLAKKAPRFPKLAF
eukprot:XP_022261011.1 basic helix-loop-helix and HMG box domain-containing protein 1 [Canis lupus familiaris]